MKRTASSVALVGLTLTGLAGCKKKDEAAPKPATPAPTAPAPTTAKPGEGSAAAAKPDVAAKPAEPAKEAPPAIGAPKGLLDCNKGERPALAGAQAKALPFALESCPSIPSVFGTLAWGMDVPTALKASKAKQVEGYQGAIDGELKVGKTRFTLSFTDKGQAKEIYFKTTQAGLDAMTAAWGAPLELTDLGDQLKLWFNAAKQTRVEVKADSSEPGEYYVRFYGYLPVAKLLAADGVLSKPIIGEAFEKVAEVVPELLEVESKEEAAANLAAAGLDPKATAIAKWAGADKAKASLVMLGTATESYLNLSLRFEGGKVESYGSLIDTMDNAALRDEYAAEFAAALGAPTAESSIEFGEPKYVFAAPGGHKVILRGKDDWFFDITK